MVGVQLPQVPKFGCQNQLLGARYDQINLILIGKCVPGGAAVQLVWDLLAVSACSISQRSRVEPVSTRLIRICGRTGRSRIVG